MMIVDQPLFVTVKMQIPTKC